MALVTIDDPPRMNLLGLMLGNLIERNLAAHEPLRRRLARLKGTVAVQAGEMRVTLCFGGGALAIRRGADPSARASIAGSMDTLLGLAQGRGMIGPVLAGRLKPRGNLLFLLRVKPLLQVI